MLRLALCVVLFWLVAGRAWGAAVVDLGTARLAIDDRGYVGALEFADGARWPAAFRPAFVLHTDRGPVIPRSVVQAHDRLTITFEDGRTAQLAVTWQRGVAVFRVTALSTHDDVQRFELFSLPAPAGAQLASQPNAAQSGAVTAAVMAVEPNVQALQGHTAVSRSDRAGCTHDFVRTGQAKVGAGAARFTACADAKPGGWSSHGSMLPSPLDLTGLKAIRAWIHGDGRGELLKIQLGDGLHGARDHYVRIDFTGWRQVTIGQSPYDTMRQDHVAGVTFYYNSLPPAKSVECLIDQVEALVEQGGRERVVVLEDFESPLSPLWSPPVPLLQVQTLRAHGILPAAFGVIACRSDEFLAAAERLERLAGLPSPHPGGVWHKLSPWTKRSYYFLTNFREADFDRALAIARRGGFHAILIGQDSWCQSTGHFEINRQRFPDGLEGLQRTVERFHQAGFRVGLHFLGASIYPPDPYLTPVPDPRLVKGATAQLAADVDAGAGFLPTQAAPDGFPDEDGGYMGRGLVVQVGDELITYGSRSLRPPYGFAGCRRGHLGTHKAAHRRGDPLRHLVRSYGYHMFDIDTSLADEVAANFAKVANTCRIDMIYFDGSELLQGDHWYYNARLHKTYYDKLTNKDTFLQASSGSHYSWHMLARAASADGHGDLKGYLEERSPWFDSFGRSFMPLDIGWYYGYDVDCPLDMYEYVLQTTIGYDSSMSFQVSPSAAARHPFTGAILDAIARYERLRLSGRVPAEMRARLRIDPILGGEKTPEQREKLWDHRRDYRLLGPPGKEVFQRVVYGPWRDVSPGEPQTQWPVSIGSGPARIGIQIHARAGVWLAPGPSYRSPQAVVLETFDDLAAYLRNAHTLPGVAQHLERIGDAREGAHAALYTAESRLATDSGWSAIGKAFRPPLDLSWHKAIGFWVRGDGEGGQLKLQLGDGRGAMDYYIPNKYVGWRYHQLLRPERDPIDYHKVSALTFYYNGLPAKKKIACAIDDVKALPAADEPVLVDPYVKMAGRRWLWRGSLRPGEYLFFWPGEPVTRYAGAREAETFPQAGPEVTLGQGEYPAVFGAAQLQAMAVRVRATYQPAERYVIP